MNTKSAHLGPVTQRALQNGKAPNHVVQRRRGEAAMLVANLGQKRFERMTAPELLTWLRDNNRVGYGNLLRALFEIIAYSGQQPIDSARQPVLQRYRGEQNESPHTAPINE